MTQNEQRLWTQIEEALDRIRPAIEADGGEIELAEVRDGVASVRMLGACTGCPMAHVTLRMGVEQTVREAVPEIIRVVRAEDDDRPF